jgi:hypothetical protein
MLRPLMTIRLLAQKNDTALSLQAESISFVETLL